MGGSQIEQSQTPGAGHLVPVHFEVRVASTSKLQNSTLRDRLERYISTLPIIEDGILDVSSENSLHEYVHSIRVSGLAERGVAPTEDNGFSNYGNDKSSSLPFWKVLPIVHMYKIADTSASPAGHVNGHKSRRNDNGGGSDSDSDSNSDSESNADSDSDIFGGQGSHDQKAAGDMQERFFTISNLPSAALEGLWESLVISPQIKSYLINLVSSGCLFSERQVDINVVAWNRCVLFHGPPGSGKTTLSRSLAQKLAIRLGYTAAKLVEVNANALFSKWFSESSKNVDELFSEIRTMAAGNQLVCVLIDEVESISSSRAASAAGTEPSDALRVVNVLLTSIDSLRLFSNVLIIATSNLKDHIDPAFLDRADVRQFIGLPPLPARYEILRSGVNELIRRGILAVSEDSRDFTSSSQVDNSAESGFAMVIPTLHSPHASESDRILKDFKKISLNDFGQCGAYMGHLDGEESLEDALHAAAIAADGMSGRTLRKLCLLAHARRTCGSGSPVDVRYFLKLLRSCAADES